MRVHANGRVRRSRSEWREIFDRFEASELSQTEFCRRESIAKGTFSRWMKVLLCGKEMIDPLFGDWPERGFWVCAVRLEDGQRVVFGRDRVEGVSVGRAVAASCAIPGVFVPVEIGAERYIDGGARSMTSVDVLAGYDCDLVIASSPMSAAAGDRRRIAFDVPMHRLLRAQLVREIEALGSGRRVIAIEPTAAEQRVMGPNPMDVGKRAEISRAVYDSTRRRLDGGDLSPLAELLGGS